MWRKFLNGILLSILTSIYVLNAEAKSDLVYNVNFQAKFIAEQKGFLVSVTIDKGNLLKRVVFKNSGQFQNLKANGTLIEQDHKVEWQLPKGRAKLQYFVKITHEKDTGEFDSYLTDTWAIFRGDDLAPAFHTYEEDGAYSQSKLEFVLPKKWSAQSSWEKAAPLEFKIDNPERQFDRPTGWFIIGKFGARQTNVAGTSITVAAPKKTDMRRMDVLTFFTFVWPQVKKTFGDIPKRLLIVGAPDPMWRGGLSAANSLYLHEDRPLVSENGTSPLFHEITHMVTHIRGKVSEDYNDDWISEGIAEYYSFILVYKAGGMSETRKEKVIKSLAKWGKEVRHLRKSKSTAKITARAVVLFVELDKEIQQKTKQRHNLDDVTRELMKKRKVGLEDLRNVVEKLIGEPSKTLQSKLLQ